MRKRFFLSVFYLFSFFLFLSGCGQNDTSDDSTGQRTVIYDLSGTYEEFTKTYFPLTPAVGQPAEFSLAFGTVTPDKELLAAVNYDGTRINFTPVTDQGTGTAFITLTVDGDEQTTYLKIYDLSRRLVSLDFDDGPSEFTDNILDTLAETGVSATFFITGKAYQDVRRVYVGAALYPETLKRAVKDGHQIGNHTYDHPWRIMDYEKGPPGQEKDWMDYSRSAVREQVERLDALLLDLVGFVPDYFAPPYGRNVHLGAIKKTIPDRLNNCSDTFDWMQETTAADIAATLLSAPGNSTVLMHDVYEKTAAGLRLALTSKEAKEIQFMTTKELNLILKRS